MSKILEFCDISMSFPGVKALSGVSFQIREGEVLALLGENGAGKSTLLKILNGDYHPTEGHIKLDGKTLHLTDPFDAISHGISIIYQERQVVQNLSVAENVFMGHLPINAYGLVDFERMHRETSALIAEFRIPIHSGDLVKNLSVAFQQMIEIIKACNHPGINVIAFDEPTASLSDDECETLFALIRQLKKKGYIILYVSHRLKELATLADRAVILKDGRFVAERNLAQCNETELVNLMVGREIKQYYGDFNRKNTPGKIVLSVKNLSSKKIHAVNFVLHEGEILGLGGLVGSGRTEVARAIFGVDPILDGMVEVEGEIVRIGSPEDAIRFGLAMCPEDRKLEGIIPRRSIMDNISMVVLRKLTKFGFVNLSEERKIVESGIENLRIKTPDTNQHMVNLSGGNQQKAILVRWIAINPKILILDEPTKGIDVGSKAEIYKIIEELAKKGLAILFITSEMTELISISDRILVMRNGSIAGELSRDAASEEAVIQLAMLGKKGETK